MDIIKIHYYDKYIKFHKYIYNSYIIYIEYIFQKKIKIKIKIRKKKFFLNIVIYLISICNILILNLFFNFINNNKIKK